MLIMATMLFLGEFGGGFYAVHDGVVLLVLAAALACSAL
jgi:hypothetical protein